VKKKSFTILLALAVSVGTFFAMPVLAASGLLKGISCITNGNCNLCDLIQILVNASNLIVAFSGALALLMFVYAGVLMIISYAYPAGIAKAKDTIKYALIGLFFIFAGYTIINFVLMSFGGDASMGGIARSYQAVTNKPVQQWGVCQIPGSK
jgi:hypothetical protein